jgi:pimeloyl-ACP methyl ester carboxylesterase
MVTRLRDKLYPETVSVAGCPIERSVPGNAHTHLFLADLRHLGTVGQGLLAQLIVTAIDAKFHAGVTPLSQREILEFASIDRLGAANVVGGTTSSRALQPTTAVAGATQDGNVNSSALAFVVPYQAGKVPVVFVHGMFGSPVNWSAAIRDLSDDPAVRDQFQFLTFRYESLRPIPDSGLRLSEALNEVRRSVDPEARDRSFDRVVLVGHSLGGLVVKAASQTPDPALFAVDSRSGQSERLAPRISRVVFIATPHRGSPVDQGAARCAGVWLARTVGASSQGEGSRASSVAQLTWDNPLLLELERARRAVALPFHSIIATVGDPSADGANDGLVPVASARLGGAQSEMVVRTRHMCIQHSDVIREVRRILIEHAAPAGVLTVGHQLRNDDIAVTTFTPAQINK